MGSNLEILLSELLAEAISTETEEQIRNADPNDVLTVYHGTALFRLPLLINGFDSTQDFKRDYRAGAHRGIFVTADFEVAKSFGGGAIIELKVRAKNLHGTDYGGNITRELQRQDPKLADWAREKFPNSFRPHMAMTMLQSPEPQALLVGLVKPSQITRVWIKELGTDHGWKEYTREEFLKSGMEFSAGQRDMRKFGDAGIDLSSPKLTMEELIKAIADSAGYGPDRVESALKFAKARAQYPDKLRAWLENIKIHGSHLGEKAIESLMKQMTDNVDESLAPLEPLLEYLLKEGKTKTDEVFQKVLEDWVERGIKAPEGPHWFPPRELFKYREYMRRTRPDLQKSISKHGFDERFPIQVKFGKDGHIKVEEGNHRMKTAIQLGLDKVPVKFNFGDSAMKMPLARSIEQQRIDRLINRDRNKNAREKAFREKYGIDKAAEEMKKKEQERLAAMSAEERAQVEAEKEKTVDELMDLLGF